MRSAAFSPTMIAGAFVLPRGTEGMTDASATRSPFEAEHAQLRVDDPSHRARRDRVVDGLDPALQEVDDVRLAVGRGHPERRAPPLGERGPRAHVHRDAHPSIIAWRSSRVAR